MDEAHRLCGAVVGSLDEEQDATGLARRAYRSRTQLYRVFWAIVEETPIAMRRRLLLERAAWQLSRTQLSVTDISINANYGSLEAFTRAFRKAFGVSPSWYRRMGATFTHLYARNGIHHHSGKDDTKGAGQFMDLFDIFSGQESWHTRRLLDLAKTLSDEQLGRPLKHPVKVFPWDGPDQSLRQILDRMVQTKEAWAAALTGGRMPLMKNAPSADQTPSAMLARLDIADANFHRVLTEVRNRNAWDDTFVDALCEPPETFTFGGVFAHVITFNAHRRMLAMDALRCPEARVEGFGCLPSTRPASRTKVPLPSGTFGIGRTGYYWVDASRPHRYSSRPDALHNLDHIEIGSRVTGQRQYATGYRTAVWLLTGKSDFDLPSNGGLAWTRRSRHFELCGRTVLHVRLGSALGPGRSWPWQSTMTSCLHYEPHHLPFKITQHVRFASRASGGAS